MMLPALLRQPFREMRYSLERALAQLDRANASGALGREFESLRAHQFPVHKRISHLRTAGLPKSRFLSEFNAPFAKLISKQTPK